MGYSLLSDDVATSKTASGKNFLFSRNRTRKTALQGVEVHQEKVSLGYENASGLPLYDYRNRVYDPALGRFLQPDPIGFEGKDVNLYRYVVNNPVNWIDPKGLIQCHTFSPIAEELQEATDIIVKDLRKTGCCIVACSIEEINDVLNGFVIDTTLIYGTNACGKRILKKKIIKTTKKIVRFLTLITSASCMYDCLNCPKKYGCEQ